MWNDWFTIVCLFGASAGCCALAVVYLSRYCREIRKALWLIPCAILFALYAGDKPEPVIVVKDIEIKSFKCDHTGCEIAWACGTNIVIGVDKFVIQRSERQIPARSGWSPFHDYGETMTTNWATATPQHASDVRFKIVVRKEPTE